MNSASDSADPASVVSSVSNAYIKRVRSLRRLEHRRALERFLVEGILPVWRAIEHRARIEALIVAPALLTSSDASAMVLEQERAGTRVVRVSASVFAHIADREHPSGLAAVIAPAPPALDSLPAGDRAIFTALHEPANPGNVGTIVRTVAATGGDGVLIVGGGTDAYHPTAVKASMGTIFSVPVVHVGDGWQHTLAWARSRGLAVVGTSARAEREIWSAPLAWPALVLFGNEGRGLPPDLRADCDEAIRIPMQGSGSLNLAVAVSVVLYEYARRRATEPG